MQADYWLQRWQEDQTGFHKPEYNPLLIQHFSSLNMPAEGRMFVPLCGKTLDIGWLLEQGCQVVAAELSELAVQQLFAQLGQVPQVAKVGAFVCYSAPQLRVFVGDIFNLTAQQIGPVDGVYDRAALVALPTDMRRSYTQQLARVTGHAPQLLICFEYDQSLMDGPPFSIPAAEVQAHYAGAFALTLLEHRAIAPENFKNTLPATEYVWHLQPYAPR